MGGQEEEGVRREGGLRRHRGGDWEGWEGVGGGQLQAAGGHASEGGRAGVRDGGACNKSGGQAHGMGGACAILLVSS